MKRIPTLRHTWGIDKIEHIEKNRIRIANHVIPISDTYADTFYKLLKGFQ